MIVIIDRIFKQHKAMIGLLIFVLLLTSITSLPTAHAVVPGENGKIAFSSARTGDQEVFVMDADGSNQTNLTNDATGDDGLPNWSPDGTQIAFTSDRDGNAEIYVMTADGSGVTRLTNNTAADVDPHWSPDGAQIVFTSFRDGAIEIYVMNADGSGQTQLTNNTANDDHPSWSPDGSQIAFYSERDGNQEIYVMNADGSGQTRLTNNPAGDNSPDWSPDSAQIAFATNRDGNQETYVMNTDGSGQTNITNSPASNDGWPAWSPDGTAITFQSNRDGNHEIYVMNADGSGQTRLTNDTAVDTTSDWGPLPQSVLNVTIDIKPGSFPNTINLGSNGTVPVAILSTADFDATTVDPATVTLANAPVAQRGRNGERLMASFEDVNGDGLLDLMVHVETEALALGVGNTEAVLEGQTFGGTPVSGSDWVRAIIRGQG